MNKEKELGSTNELQFFGIPDKYFYRITYMKRDLTIFVQNIIRNKI